MGGEDAGGWAWKCQRRKIPRRALLVSEGRDGVMPPCEAARESIHREGFLFPGQGKEGQVGSSWEADFLTSAESKESGMPLSQ